MNAVRKIMGLFGLAWLTEICFRPLVRALAMETQLRSDSQVSRAVASMATTIGSGSINWEGEQRELGMQNRTQAA